MRKVAIEVKNLSKTFGDYHAVKNISFKVYQGEIFAMLGSNGAGKTTTINMLTTLLNPTSGDLMVGGATLSHVKEIRKKISLTGQFASLDEELTGYENLKILGSLNRIPKKVLNEKIKELLLAFDLENASKKVVKSYSGGMKRRLDIATSLLNEPEILFLDEPTTGIDPQNRLKIWDMVKSLAREKQMTIFLTTQYLEEAENLADYALIMNNGSIIKEGDIASLKQSLDKSEVIFGFDEENLSQVKDILNQNKVRGWSYKDDDTIRVATNSKVETLTRLLNTFEETNLTVTDINIKESSLEDVYLEAIKEEV